jgi:hypothetical protein
MNRLFSTLLVAFSAVALAAPAFATPAETFREPIDFVFFPECPGAEPIHLTGELHGVRHEETTSQGDTMVSMQFVWSDLTAIGFFSGDRYILTYPHGSVGRIPASPDGTLLFTERRTIVAVKPGSGIAFVFHSIVHMTVTPSGQSVQFADVSCHPEAA